MLKKVCILFFFFFLAGFAQDDNDSYDGESAPDTAAYTAANVDD